MIIKIVMVVVVGMIMIIIKASPCLESLSGMFHTWTPPFSSSVNYCTEKDAGPNAWCRCACGCAGAVLPFLSCTDNRVNSFLIEV